MKTILSILALLFCLCCYSERAQAQQYTYTSSWQAHSYQSVDDALHCWVSAYANSIGSPAPNCSKSSNSALCAYSAGWFGTQYFNTTVSLSNGYWNGYINNTLLGQMGYLFWDSSQTSHWNGYSWTLYTVQYYTYNGRGQGSCTLYQMPLGQYPNGYYYATFTGSAF